MKEEAIGLKILLSYQLETAYTQEYYQFILGRYIPAMQEMGLQMSEAWHTAYGNVPNRLVGFVCRDWQTIEELLADESWLDLNQQLKQYVSRFSYKVIPYRGGFQI
jgi:hypothetical protein